MLMIPVPAGTKMIQHKPVVFMARNGEWIFWEMQALNMVYIGFF